MENTFTTNTLAKGGKALSKWTHLMGDIAAAMAMDLPRKCGETDELGRRENLYKLPLDLYDGNKIAINHNFHQIETASN